MGIMPFYFALTPHLEMRKYDKKFVYNVVNYVTFTLYIITHYHRTKIINCIREYCYN